MNLTALRPSPRARRIQSADKRVDAITAPPEPVAPASAVDAIRAAVRPAGRPATSEQPDVETVREAIRGGSTRRTVVRTGVWSVPVVAAAVAAPAFAASPGVCSACNGAQPVQCTINVVVGQPLPPGACRCADGLVCATVGPLGLLNVCVGTGLLSTQCGATTCTGICVAAGGAVINAVNVLTGTLSVALASLNLIPGCTAGVTGFIPNNICVVPVTNVNAGNFGALCLTNTGSGLIAGTANGAVDLLKTTINALGVGGLLFANSCASPYSCKPGVRAAATGSCAGQSLSLTVGFCQC